MEEKAMQRMLRMLRRGRIPEAEDLGLGREEFVSLVSQAVADDLISGVYISFCDNESIHGLLSSAVLTDRGREFCRKRWSPFSFARKRKT